MEKNQFIHDEKLKALYRALTNQKLILRWGIGAVTLPKKWEINIT